MPTLAELQQAFLAAVLHGDGALAAEVAGTAELSPDARLGIYRGSVRGVLREALALTYPAVARVVGDKFFAALASRYAAAWPSTSSNLDDFGGHLGDFLAAFEPARSLPYVADLARLEWACHQAQRAAVGRPAQPLSRLAELQPAAQAGARLQTSPGLSALSSAYPVDVIRAAQLLDEVPAIELSSADGSEPFRWAIWRGSAGLRVERVEASLWPLLQGLLRQQALGELLDLCGGDAAALAAAQAQGWICGLREPVATTTE